MVSLWLGLKRGIVLTEGIADMVGKMFLELSSIDCFAFTISDAISSNNYEVKIIISNTNYKKKKKKKKEESFKLLCGQRQRAEAKLLPDVAEHVACNYEHLGANHPVNNL
jgi:hypothetical protein